MALPPRDSAKSANTLCSRSAASVLRGGLTPRQSRGENSGHDRLWVSEVAGTTGYLDGSCGRAKSKEQRAKSKDERRKEKGERRKEGI